MKYYNTPKKTRSMSVYIILALCLVALGIGAKTLLNAVTDGNADASSTPSNTTSKLDNVNNIISDITYSNISSSNVSSEQPSQTQTSSESEPVNKPAESEPKQTVANYFVMPVTGNIIKGYSDTELSYSATFNDMRLHSGVDIAADTGTAIKSAGDGVVKEIKTDDLLGVTVIIDHGNGILAYYSGLSPDPLVKADDTVHAGTVLGSLGTVPSESLDQSHLHFSITKDGKYVSPLKIMGMEE